MIFFCPRFDHEKEKLVKKEKIIILLFIVVVYFFSIYLYTIERYTLETLKTTIKTKDLLRIFTDINIQVQEKTPKNIIRFKVILTLLK